MIIVLDDGHAVDITKGRPVLVTPVGVIVHWAAVDASNHPIGNTLLPWHRIKWIKFNDDERGWFPDAYCTFTV